MTTNQLSEILLKHKLCIDLVRKTVGTFAQYEIGTGRLMPPLLAAMDEIRPLHKDCRVAEVDNPAHEQYQQRYLFIDSFAADEHIDPTEHNRVVRSMALRDALEGLLAEFKGGHINFLDGLADFLGGEQWEIDPSIGSAYDIDDAVDCIRRAIGQHHDDDEEEDEDE